MSPHARASLAWAWPWLGALAGAAAAGPLQAQAELPPDIPRERTGPQAAPPVTPPYATPVDAPPRPAVQAVPAPVPPARRSNFSIREVRVIGAVEAKAAPPSIWTPPGDAASGLRLEHRKGERLDSEWVRRQFVANMIPGQGMPADRAVALVQLINRAYLTAGFLSSGVTVPEQRALAEGMLELRLVIGRLALAEPEGRNVIVEWGGGRSAGLSDSYVRRRFPSRRGQPLSALDIERDFRLLAQDPFIRTIDTDLRPGAEPGEATLHVIIHPARRFDFYLAGANDRSPSVGGERFSIGGYFRNLIAAGDLVSAEGGTTEGARDAQLSYSTPFLTPRTTLLLRASLNEAAVIDRPLVPLDIRTRDRSFQGGLTHRIIAEPLAPAAEPGRWSSSRSFAAGFLLVHRRQKSFLLGEPFSFAPGSVDGRSEYTAIRATADYLARNVGQVFAAALTGTIGLDGTRSDEPGVLNPRRNFKSLLVQVNYARRLRGFELRGRIAGQVADGILYSGERISIGGESSVRGYREGLFLADRGVIGSVELARPFSLSGRNRSASRFDWGGFTASAFADAARFGNADPPQPAIRSIAGAGVSLTWNPSDAIAARLSYGLDLKKVPIAGARDLQDSGIHFRVTLYPARLLGE